MSSTPKTNSASKMMSKKLRRASESFQKKIPKQLKQKQSGSLLRSPDSPHIGDELDHRVYELHENNGSSHSSDYRDDGIMIDHRSGSNNNHDNDNNNTNGNTNNNGSTNDDDDDNGGADNTSGTASSPMASPTPGGMMDDDDDEDDNHHLATTTMPLFSTPQSSNESSTPMSAIASPPPALGPPLAEPSSDNPFLDDGDDDDDDDDNTMDTADHNNNGSREGIRMHMERNQSISSSSPSLANHHPINNNEYATGNNNSVMELFEDDSIMGMSADLVEDDHSDDEDDVIIDELGGGVASSVVLSELGVVVAGAGGEAMSPSVAAMRGRGFSLESWNNNQSSVEEEEEEGGGGSHDVDVVIIIDDGNKEQRLRADSVIDRSDSGNIITKGLRIGHHDDYDSVAGAGDDDDDSVLEEGCSIESDDDYYRRDYFVLGAAHAAVSESEKGMYDDDDDDDDDGNNGDDYSEGNDDDGKSGSHPWRSGKSGERDESESFIGPETISEVEGDHYYNADSFRADAADPSDSTAAPAKRDYEAHFDTILSSPAEDDEEGGPGGPGGIMPPRNEEFREEHDARGAKLKGKEFGEKSSGRGGRGSRSPKKEKNEGKASESTTPRDASNEEDGGKPKSAFDAALALKQASIKDLHNDSENAIGDEKGNRDEFASALRQVERMSNSTLGATGSEDGNMLRKAKKKGHEPKSPKIPKKGHSHKSSKTPKSHKKMLDRIEQIANSSPLSPEGDVPMPLYSEDVSKMAKENRKLRKRRKELLALLGSMAQQFSSYERVCSKKISQLEEKNQLLLNPNKNEDFELALSVSRANGEEDGKDDSPEKSLNGDDGSSSINKNNVLPGGSNSKKYDATVVRRLSNGVLMQEKQLKSKDEHITQLKLRCEVLKQSLMDKDEENMEEKKKWERERAKLLKKMETGSASSISAEDHGGELLTKKMEVTRLTRELKTASNDITTLTTALETNNEALDATVVELDKLKEWKAQYGEAAASLVALPEESRLTTDAETLRSELKDKDKEVADLQSDLESSLNEIEELRADIKFAAKARGYEDFHNVVENLKMVAKVCKEDKDIANEKIAKLEEQLRLKGGEIEQLQAVKPQFNSAPVTGVSANILQAVTQSMHGPTKSMPDEDAPLDGQQVALPHTTRRRLFGRLGSKNDPVGATDFPTMVRQRDLKIKSLEAMIKSNSRIMEKLKNDVERMDNEKEEVEWTMQQKIDNLKEENEMYEMQVEGYEKTFRTLNEQRVEDIVDDNMWDESGGSNNGVEAKEDAVDDLRSKNSTLHRMITELESSGSFQEDQVETLKAQLIKLRVKSQQEKEVAVAQLQEENKIITAQRSALESQLVEINKSAGVYRDLLSVPHSPSAADGNDGVAGSDPILVTQVVMLENANKVLKSSVASLRDDMQEKLAPLLANIAMLEEDKRMVEEEMETKLSCREMTIMNLESSLQQLQKMRSSTMRKMSVDSKPSTPSHTPDRSAIKKGR